MADSSDCYVRIEQTLILKIIESDGLISGHLLLQPFLEASQLLLHQVLLRFQESEIGRIVKVLGDQIK